MLPAVFGRVTDYRDEDLTFIVQTRHDAAQLDWMLGHLRRHFATARVVICSDGDDDPSLPILAKNYTAEFHHGEYLYDLRFGGQICQRLLELFCRRPTKYLFKIDTDTGFHRRFQYLPSHPGLFGTLQGNTAFMSIQGGCVGITGEVAERMYRSGALLDSALLRPEMTWSFDPSLLRYVRSQGKVCEDWIFGYVATALGIPIFGFPEVASSWKHYIPNPGRRFAVTHPCKDGKL